MTGGSAVDFVIGFVRDPISKDGSSARAGAMLCIGTACVVALRWAPNAWTAGVILALVGGAWAALNNRVKSDSPCGPACVTATEVTS